MSSSTSVVSSSSERFIGSVKWFNNKTGYGFITVTDGPKSGTDVFVHHSSIRVVSEQYKYLVQGEYVEFSLTTTKTNNHEFQAGDVSGVKGGKLMCETRHDSKTARNHYRAFKNTTEASASTEPVRMPRSVRARGQGPRDDGGHWSYVSKPKNNTGVRQRDNIQRTNTTGRT
jgi:cold shock CspA family protein